MMRITIIIAAILLAGCQQVGRLIDPDVAQLERFDTAQNEGRLRDIADEPVVTSCTPEKPACGRLHAIRAEACLTLAMQGRAPAAACPAPSAEVRRDLACAASGYAAAMEAKGSEFSAADRLAHRRGRAQALYCRAELDSPTAGAPLAREAAQVSAGLPPPDRQLLGGSSALFLARPGIGPDTARCEQARAALRLAREGLAASPGPDDRAALTRLAADAETRRASIPGCGA